MSDFTSSLYGKLRFPAVFNRIGTFCNHGLAGNCPARVLVAGRRSLSVRLLSPPSKSCQEPTLSLNLQLSLVMERRQKPIVTEPNGSRPHRESIDSLLPEGSCSPLSRRENSGDTKDHLPSDL